MEILNDGHIAVHLPNVKDGLIVTEQFYKLKTARNGKKKMEDAWGVGGFCITRRGLSSKQRSIYYQGSSC